MRKYCVFFVLFCLVSLNASCAWIDDVGTVSKKGSYQFTLSATEQDENGSAQSVTNDAIECMEKHTSQSFDVFDAQSNQDTSWQILMYDQVRNTKDAVILSVEFQGWSQEEPMVACPSPETLVGTSIDLTLDGCVHASLAMGVCSPKQAYRIVGTLQLDEFSTERREPVAGSIDGTLVLLRYVNTAAGSTRGEIEIGSISAEFQFPVHVGPVWMR